MTKKSNAKIRPAKDGTSSSPSIASWKNIGTILKLAAVVAAIAFAYILSRQSQHAIVNLTNADQKHLKEAIYGDFPHLFYCDRGNGKAIPAIFSDLNTLRGSKMGFGILNCSQVLPSGKTIYERFKLKKEWRPTIWGTAPWAKPTQAGPAHMKDVNTLKKFVDDHFHPRSKAVKSTAQLIKSCGFDKSTRKTPVSDRDGEDDGKLEDTCIVISKGKRFGQNQQDLEEHLVSTFPKTKIVSVDASKLRFSFESIEELPADAFSMRVHALRNASHYLTMGNPPTWDYLHTFVSSAVASDISDFMHREDNAPITLTVPGREEKKKKTTKKSPKKAPAKPKPTLEDDELIGLGEKVAADKDDVEKVKKDSATKEATARILEAAAKAEAERKRMERERQVREEMDRMEREYLFEEGGDESEEEGAEEAEVDMDDEETIEL